MPKQTKKVDSKLAKANSAFGRLCERVGNNKNLKKDTKINVNVHVLKERNCHHGNTQWISRRHHNRSLEVFRPLADRRTHVLTYADDNVKDKSDMYLALDVLLSEHRGCPTEVSFCCSVGFFVDFEKNPVSVHIGPIQCC